MGEPTKTNTNDTAVTTVSNPQAAEQPVDKFKPGWRLLCAFASIVVVNLACALDATIVAVALPVGAFDHLSALYYPQALIDVYP